ncbi:MAG: SIMPL domain-containing protein [Actinomycetota bacterium]
MSKRLAGLLILALALGACSRTTVETPAAGRDASGLVVTGVGRVEVRPDTLVVSMGVVSEAASATEALDAVSRGARAMLQAIVANGVPERDIRTTRLDVNPQFDDRGTIIGFAGTEMFRVTIGDLTKAGEVVAAAVAAAGDDARVERMSLEVSDEEAAREQARMRAVEDAIRRGEELADTAGVKLGSPFSIREISGFGGGAALRLPATLNADTAKAFASLAPRIETGTQEITVRVEVRFEIRD